MSIQYSKSKLMQNQFSSLMSKKTNEELLKIVTEQRGDYQLEAIQCAEQEIIARNLWNDKVSHSIQEKINEENIMVPIDPKELWKSARWGIISFCIVHFIFEIIIGNSKGAVLPVLFNYFISSLYIKHLISKEKYKDGMFFKGILVAFVIFIIRLALGFIFTTFI